MGVGGAFGQSPHGTTPSLLLPLTLSTIRTAVQTYNVTVFKKKMWKFRWFKNG